MAGLAVMIMMLVMMTVMSLQLNDESLTTDYADDKKVRMVTSLST